MSDLTTRLPHYADYATDPLQHQETGEPSGANAIDHEAAQADIKFTRRSGLLATLAAGVSLLAKDKLGGKVERIKMKHEPEAHIFEQPNSNIVMVSLPGNRNDGLIMGALLKMYAFEEANVVAVSYAEDNIDERKLARLIAEKIDSVSVPNPDEKKIGFYINSISAAASVPVFKILQAWGITAEIVMFDSGLRTREGARGINKLAAKIRLDKLGESRTLNGFMSWFVNKSIPPAAADKDGKVDLTLAEFHRRRTVDCDTITQSEQAAALDIPVVRGQLKGFARKLIYFKTPGSNPPYKPPYRPDDGIDPLVDSEVNVEQIAIDYDQDVQLFTDYGRTANSHGNGPIWPDGLKQYFKNFFGIKSKQ